MYSTKLIVWMKVFVVLGSVNVLGLSASYARPCREIPGCADLKVGEKGPVRATLMLRNDVIDNGASRWVHTLKVTYVDTYLERNESRLNICSSGSSDAESGHVGNRVASSASVVFLSPNNPRTVLAQKSMHAECAAPNDFPIRGRATWSVDLEDDPSLYNALFPLSQAGSRASRLVVAFSNDQTAWDDNSGQNYTLELE